MGKARGETVSVEIGILAPCPEWRSCKMPRTALGGQFVIERMGNTYWAGTIFCLRCSKHTPVDLFEDKESNLVMRDPQADQVIGPDEKEIVEALIQP